MWEWLMMCVAGCVWCVACMCCARDSRGSLSRSRTFGRAPRWSFLDLRADGAAAAGAHRRRAEGLGRGPPAGLHGLRGLGDPAGAQRALPGGAAPCRAAHSRGGGGEGGKGSEGSFALYFVDLRFGIETVRLSRGPLFVPSLFPAAPRLPRPSCSTRTWRRPRSRSWPRGPSTSSSSTGASSSSTCTVASRHLLRQHLRRRRLRPRRLLRQHLSRVRMPR